MAPGYLIHLIHLSLPKSKNDYVKGRAGQMERRFSDWSGGTWCWQPLNAGNNTWQGLHSVLTHCAAPQQRQGPFEEGNEEHLIKEQTLMHKQRDGDLLCCQSPMAKGCSGPPLPLHIAFHIEHALNLQGCMTYLPPEKMLSYTMVLFVGRKEVGRQY